ncbi:MAG: luxR [Cereibacter sp.]|nr:luxR [Cereibacter sp.]
MGDSRDPAVRCRGEGEPIDTADRLIHQIYAAVLEPQGWAAVGDSLAALIDGATVHMFLVSAETGRTYINLFARGDPDFAPTYLEGYAADDFRVSRVLARPAGLFGPERAYVSADEARRSRVHQELLPRFGIHDINGANLSFDDCIGWFGIAQSRPGRGIDPMPARLLANLTPHLLRAFRMTRRQADLEHPAAAAPLADLPVAAVFIFEAGQMVHLNRTAERLLAEGWFRIGREGQLSCADRRNAARLAAFHADGRPEGALLLRDSDSGAVHVLRRMAGVWPQQARQVLTITLLTPPPPNEEEVATFCEPFGLSPAEQRAVRAVLVSQPLSALAREAGLSLYTVQDQLKSAMQKMGLPSQKLVFAAFERSRAVVLPRRSRELDLSGNR